jgi:hypothetical protein
MVPLPGLARKEKAAEAVLSANADIVRLRDDFRLDDQPAILAAADRPAHAKGR